MRSRAGVADPFKSTLVSYYTLDATAPLRNVSRSHTKTYVNASRSSTPREVALAQAEEQEPSESVEYIDETTKGDPSHFRVHRAWPREKHHPSPSSPRVRPPGRR